jgi:protein-S-isoprenylcysteine O-methyltransferase Ste14
MKREKAIEIATYITVLFAVLVILPLLARWLDSFYVQSHPVFATSPTLLIFGILVTLLGWGLGIWTIYLFKTIGQGTPNPTLPPKQLVTSGPYTYIRNPMALGGFYLLLGEAALYASPSLVGIAILYLVILYCYVRWVEEPILVRRFGKPYRKYLQTVPRFFPNPFRRK